MAAMTPPTTQSSNHSTYYPGQTSNVRAEREHEEGHGNRYTGSNETTTLGAERGNSRAHGPTTNDNAARGNPELPGRSGEEAHDNGDERIDSHRTTDPRAEGHGPPAPASGAASPTPEKIALTVRDQNGGEQHYQLRTNTKMEKLMSRFCDHSGVSPEVVRFLFEGVRVVNDDTPESVRTKGGKVLCCFGGWWIC